MKILVTGAKGFVGQNLCAQLLNIAEGKAKWYDLKGEGLEVFRYDIDSTPEELDRYCKDYILYPCAYGYCSKRRQNGDRAL